MVTDVAKYRFTFSTDGPYGHVVHLLEDSAKPEGLIIDLGCGYGAVAEPVSERGWEYLGFDLDGEAVEDVRSRGFEAHVLDLSTADLVEIVKRTIAGRRVAAILMLDIVEHLPDFKPFLAAVRRIAGANEACLAVVSIPNVGHLEVAAKLLTGRWDNTPTGLLDETHLHFFTDRHLTAVMRAHGLREIARDDFILTESDQHFPRLHPALADGTPLRGFAEWVRGQADPFLYVNQFVRAYAPTEPEETRASNDADDVPFVSVLLRTQGSRPRNLIDALTCLGAQTCQDFECLLLVHNAAENDIESVRAIADDFDGFVGRGIRVLLINEGLRGRPLNVGLADARGEYVVFLDDDDHVVSSWIQTFQDGAGKAPGRIVRTRAWARKIDQDDGPVAAGFRLGGWPQLKYGGRFNFIEHLRTNTTPICCYAVPMEAVRTLGLSFDETLGVHEDWDFLLRASNLVGVLDVEEPTSIYHHWGEGESSRSISVEEWDRTRKHVSDAWASRPILLPPEEVGGLLLSLDSVRALETRTHRAEKEAERAARRAGAAETAAIKAKKELHRVVNSRSWKMGAPLRRLRRMQDRVQAAIRRTTKPPDTPNA